MNSVETSPSPLQPPFGKIVLEIRLGQHIPSFKNHKRIAGQRLITRKDIKKRMEELTRHIESALCGSYQTDADAIRTGCSRASWIRSRIPLDDSLNWIPESDGWRTRMVPKGQEGVIITIEQIKACPFPQ